MRIFSVVLPSLVPTQASECFVSSDFTASYLAASCTILLCLVKEDVPFVLLQKPPYVDNSLLIVVE